MDISLNIKKIFSFVAGLYKREPVESEYYQYTNPDGSIGGLVSKNAEIDPTSHVEIFGTVLPYSKVPPNTKIMNGEFYTSDNHHLTLI